MIICPANNRRMDISDNSRLILATIWHCSLPTRLAARRPMVGIRLEPQKVRFRWCYSFYIECLCRLCALLLLILLPPPLLLLPPLLPLLPKRLPISLENLLPYVCISKLLRLQFPSSWTMMKLARPTALISRCVPARWEENLSHLLGRRRFGWWTDPDPCDCRIEQTTTAAFQLIYECHADRLSLFQDPNLGIHGTKILISRKKKNEDTQLLWWTIHCNRTRSMQINHLIQIPVLWIKSRLNQTSFESNHHLNQITNWIKSPFELNHHSNQITIWIKSSFKSNHHLNQIII